MINMPLITLLHFLPHIVKSSLKYIKGDSPVTYQSRGCLGFILIFLKEKVIFFYQKSIPNVLFVEYYVEAMCLQHDTFLIYTLVASHH